MKRAAAILLLLAYAAPGQQIDQPPRVSISPIVVVFLSYAHQDRTLAKSIASELRTAGCAVWSQENIKPGRPWTLEVQAAIDRSDAVVTIISAASGRSYWVGAELMRAQRKHVRIVPVIADQAADIPLVLSGVEWGVIGRLGLDLGCTKSNTMRGW